MIIRTATIDDIPELCELEKECFSLPWSRKNFEDFFALDFTVAFAAVERTVNGERIVGYAGLYISGNEGDITNIAVNAEYRRKGIGRALIEELKKVPNIDTLYLEVRESNLAAKALYEAQGFTADGIRKNFYHNPRENAILMSFGRP